MAKYEVTYACGCTKTVELFGKTEERQRKIAYYQEQCICEECYKRAIEEKNKKAKEEAEKHSLPELTGSPKQVSWANSIRQDFIDGVNHFAKLGTIIPAKASQVSAIVSAETSAKWWIDNRKTHPQNLLERWIKEHTTEEPLEIGINVTVTYDSTVENLPVQYAETQENTTQVETGLNVKFAYANIVKTAPNVEIVFPYEEPEEIPEEETAATVKNSVIAFKVGKTYTQKIYTLEVLKRTEKTLTGNAYNGIYTENSRRKSIHVGSFRNTDGDILQAEYISKPYITALGDGWEPVPDENPETIDDVLTRTLSALPTAPTVSEKETVKDYFGKSYEIHNFVDGGIYRVSASRLKSASAELVFVVLKNTRKSLKVTAFEKYNGVVTCTAENVTKPCHPCSMEPTAKIDGTNLSRWAKGHISVTSTEKIDPQELKAFVNGSAPAPAPQETKAPAKVDYTTSEHFRPINEDLARLANDLNTYNDYTPSSATNTYRQQVEKAFAMVNESSNPEKSLYFADLYAKKLADYYNALYRCESYCPSILIAGPQRFPVAKKQRQNARRVQLCKVWENVENLLKYVENPNRHKDGEKIRDTISVQEFENNGYFTVVNNTDENRLQLTGFPEIPTDEQKSVLKKHGFKWSRRFQAWQRQTTENAVQAIHTVIAQFAALEDAEIIATAGEIQKLSAPEPAPVETTEPREVRTTAPHPAEESQETPTDAKTVQEITAPVVHPAGTLAAPTIATAAAQHQTTRTTTPPPAEESQEAPADAEAIQEITATVVHPVGTLTAPIQSPRKSKARRKSKYSKSTVCRMAWRIRKAYAANLGCKVIEISMSVCMVQAWASHKAAIDNPETAPEEVA